MSLTRRSIARGNFRRFFRCFCSPLDLAYMYVLRCCPAIGNTVARVAKWRLGLTAKPRVSSFSLFIQS